MMKEISKTDRYILIGSIGVLLISLCITFERVVKQELKKERLHFAQQENHKKETFNIKTWRSYHTEQMILMQKILEELKHQNTHPVWSRQNQNIKVRFQKSNLKTKN